MRLPWWASGCDRVVRCGRHGVPVHGYGSYLVDKVPTPRNQGARVDAHHIEVKEAVGVKYGGKNFPA
jgi:hypothetical protein